MNRTAACIAVVILMMLGTVSDAQNVGLHTEIDSRAEAINDKVIAWRRDIHEHPELSNEEVRTGKLVAKHLKSLGLEVETGIANTGVVGILRGGKPGKVVALRADMDGLPVEEKVDVPFASKARGKYRGNDVGIMHACGHDMHVAILMGAAEVLSGMKDEISGTIKFIFQPAEEGPGGADTMVEAGVLKNPDVDAIFGLHVTQGWSVGEMGVRAGGAMAGSDYFTIVVKGKQTHAAAPWLGVDPIVVSAQVILGMQTIISRQVDVTAAPAVLTIGTINGGIRSNIIPDDVTLRGTIRTFEPNMQDDIHARLRNTVESIAASAGADAEISIVKSAPVTYNDPELTRQMRATLERVAGASKVLESPLVTGAEDFAYFQKEIPGMFFFLGVRPEDVPKADLIANHSPLFYSDEDSLPIGVRAMAGLAVDYLSE